MLYTAQLLLLFVFMAAFKDTTLFNPKAFAFTLLAATIVWVAAQARAYMKAKILYVDPDSVKAEKPETDGVADVRGRAGINARSGSCYRPVPTAALRARASELTPVRSRGSMPDSRPHIRNTSPVPNSRLRAAPTQRGCRTYAPR